LALILNGRDNALGNPVPTSGPIRSNTNGFRSDVLDVGTGLHRNETESLFLLFSGVIGKEVVSVAGVNFRSVEFFDLTVHLAEKFETHSVLVF